MSGYGASTPPVLLSCQLLHHTMCMLLPLFGAVLYGMHQADISFSHEMQKFNTDTGCSAHRLRSCFKHRTFLSLSFALAIHVAYGSDAIADQAAHLGHARCCTAEIRRLSAERGVRGWRVLLTAIVKEWSTLGAFSLQIWSHWSRLFTVLACT